MAATRKDIQKAEEARISQIGDFKNRIGGTQELPSGFTVKVRNPGGLQAFLAGGTIPNSLMPLIQKALKSGKAPDAKEFLSKDGEVDPALLTDMFEMMDNIAVQCIVEPRIHPKLTQADVEKWNAENPDKRVSDPEDLRRADTLYVDELPMDDKQFLMQWIMGGTRNLETFRQQQLEGVDDVAAKQNAVRAAQRAAGADPR